MSVIRRWDKSKPPTGPFALNRDCPQAQGLVAWYPRGMASGGVYTPDLCGSTHMAGTGAASLGPRGDHALVLTAASSQFHTGGAPVTSGDFSLHVFASSTSIASTQSVIALGHSSTTYNEQGSLLLVSSKLWANRQSSSATYEPAIGGSTLASNTVYGLGGSWTGSLSRRCYVNGVLDGTSSVFVGPVSANQLNLGKRATVGDTQYFGGSLFEAGVWNLVLGADIFARLNDPGTRFELWYPLRSRKWFTQSSSVSGTSATTNANDTSSASGTTTVVGTLARTNANDTSSASGTTTVVGTSATTNAADTSSASGTVGGGVSGTSATTNANDTSSASGTTTVVGTSATTNAADTASASGTTTVTGTSATTNAADTATASGAAGTVTGTAAVTNADDTASASGVSGTPRTATGAGRSRRRRPHVVEIDGHDFVVGSAEEAEALLESARQEAEEVARKAVERASKVKNRPVRKVIADARKALAPPEIRAPGIEDYAAQVTQHIEALYADALRTIEIAALIAKREREDEDDEDVLLLMA